MAIDLETYRKLSTEELRELPWEELEELNRMATRYHEAGHAVMAYQCKYMIKSVTATDEVQLTQYRGHITSSIMETIIDLHWNEARISLAGPFAEHIALWGEVRPQPWEEFLSDMELIREDEGFYDDMADIDDIKLLEAMEELSSTRYGEGGLEDLYDNIVKSARFMVLSLWPQIKAVAGALESTGYLDGPEVEKIIEEYRE